MLQTFRRGFLRAFGLLVVMGVAAVVLGVSGGDNPSAMIPVADRLTLSQSTGGGSMFGCRVTAHLWFSGNPSYVYTDIVNFNVVSGPPLTIPSGVTDANSDVKRTIPRLMNGNRIIRATVGAGPGLISNNFTCPGLVYQASTKVK